MRHLLSTLLIAATIASPSLAQDKLLANGTRIGSWTVACEAIAVGVTKCALSQRLVRTDDNSFLVELLALWNEDLDKRLLIARVPTGAYLPSGFVMGLGDGKDQKTFAWQACGAQVCEALLELDDATLGDIGALEEVTVGYRPSVQVEPLVFKIVVDGLSDGLAQLYTALGGKPA